MLQELRNSLSRVSTQKLLKACVAIVLVSGWLLSTGDRAQSQEAGGVKAKPVAYIEVPRSEAMKDSNVVKEKQRIKNEMLKGAVAFNKQELEAYYRGFLIPVLTTLSTPEWANIARREIYEDIERAEKASDSVMNEFNAMLLSYMKTIAEGDYQPSSAIVATQILGRLNSTRAKAPTAAIPLGSATAPLFKLYSEGKNDGIRAAALVGLERHIEVMSGTWTDAQRQSIADKFLVSLKAPKPAHRDPRSDAWLRGRAIELILKIKPAKETELYQYAITALADPKIDPLLVEKALLVVGSYPAPELAPAVVKPALSNSMHYLLTKTKVWKSGVNEAQYMGNVGGDSEADLSVDDGSSMVDDGSGDEGMKPTKAPKKVKPPNPFEKQAADVKAKRRAMHELLEPLRYGLTGTHIGVLPTDSKKGLAALVPEGEDRQLMSDVLNAMKDLQDTLNSPTIVDRMGLSTETTSKVDGLIAAVELFLSVLAEDAALNTPAAAPAAAEVTAVPVR